MSSTASYALVDEAPKRRHSRRNAHKGERGREGDGEKPRRKHRSSHNDDDRIVSRKEYSYSKRTTVREVTPSPPGYGRSAMLNGSGQIMVSGAVNGLGAMADGLEEMERRDPHAAKRMKRGMRKELLARQESLEDIVTRFGKMGIVGEKKKKKKHRSTPAVEAPPPTRRSPPLPEPTDSEPEYSDIPYDEFFDGPRR